MTNENKLPPIPEKRYFTIGEASDLCGVKPHVLRYWQREFPQLEPVTRRGDRRYYQHKDIVLVRQIRSLLYEQGFTINGARQQFSSSSANSSLSSVVAEDQKALLDSLVIELEDIMHDLRASNGE